MTLAETHAALQHAPRPLPLFLDLVRRVAADDPELARRALMGVRRYGAAERPALPPRRTISAGPLTFHVAGDAGPPVVLIPSLINPASVLDVDPEHSLLAHIGASGFRAMLLDWGSLARMKRDRDLAGHVTELLLPALAALGEPVHLVGYCLGGILAGAAAQLAGARSLTLLAAPWRFASYPEASRIALTRLWSDNAAAVDQLGLMPMELLQTAFWSLDPARTVAKYAAIADCAPNDPQLVRFARIEDWANGGEPLTAAAGRDLFDRLIARDETGAGCWRVADTVIDLTTLAMPVRQFTAAGDRIAPAETAHPALATEQCPSGHVGMIVGSSAHRTSWPALVGWLRRADQAKR